MAQFDVYPDGEGEYLLDVQSNVLASLNTRVVVPLLMPPDAPLAAQHLNPEFRLHGRRVVMVTQLLSAIPASEVQHPVASLANERYTIQNALDRLTGSS